LQRLLKRTVRALEKEGASRGLLDPDASDADVREKFERFYNVDSATEKDGSGRKRTNLEKKLEELGLPVDLR